ncbi:hypothetical protein ACFX10_036409 [Malus domestica]
MGRVLSLSEALSLTPFNISEKYNNQWGRSPNIGVNHDTSCVIYFLTDSRSDLRCSKTSGFVHQHLTPYVGIDTKNYVGSLSFFHLHRKSKKSAKKPNNPEFSQKSRHPQKLISLSLTTDPRAQEISEAIGFHDAVSSVGKCGGAERTSTATDTVSGATIATNLTCKTIVEFAFTVAVAGGGPFPEAINAASDDSAVSEIVVYTRLIKLSKILKEALLLLSMTARVAMSLLHWVLMVEMVENNCIGALQPMDLWLFLRNWKS